MSEVGRKSVHLFFGTLFILSAVFIGTEFTFFVAVACLVGGVIVSDMIKQGMSFPFFSLAVELFERDYEKHWPGKGAIMFFAGTSIMIYFALYVLQAPEIIALALVPLVFGDGFATIIGVKYGKHKIVKGKSLEGTLAGFIASALVLSLFLFPAGFKILAVAGGAMLVELLPIDDNLTIPITSGLILYIMI